MSKGTDFDIGALERDVRMVLDDLFQMDIPDWISDHRGAEELYGDVRAYGYYDFGIPKLRKLKWFSKDSKDDDATEPYDPIPSDPSAPIYSGLPGVGGASQDDTARIVAEIEDNAREAASLLTRKEIVIKKICPALSRVTDDVFSLSSQVTPVIVALALSGAVPIPLNPVFIALVVLMISRMGVATLCAGSKGKAQ